MQADRGLVREALGTRVRPGQAHEHGQPAGASGEAGERRSVEAGPLETARVRPDVVVADPGRGDDAEPPASCREAGGHDLRANDERARALRAEQPLLAG